MTAEQLAAEVRQAFAPTVAPLPQRPTCRKCSKVLSWDWERGQYVSTDQSPYCGGPTPAPWFTRHEAQS